MTEKVYFGFDATWIVPLPGFQKFGIWIRHGIAFWQIIGMIFSIQDKFLYLIQYKDVVYLCLFFQKKIGPVVHISEKKKVLLVKYNLENKIFVAYCSLHIHSTQIKSFSWEKLELAAFQQGSFVFQACLLIFPARKKVFPPSLLAQH